MTVLKLPGYIVFSLFLIAANLLPLGDGAKLFFGLIYLFFYSLIFGNWLFFKNNFFSKLILGLLFTLITASLIMTGFFYLYQINSVAWALTVILIPLLLSVPAGKYPLIIEWRKLTIDFQTKHLALLTTYLVIMAAIITILFNSSTTEAIRTPWQTVSQPIFLLYFLGTLFLFIYVSTVKSTFNQLLLALHFFVTFSVTAIIYQIGFDYDPFIHRQNVDLIINNGTLLPKPFYYIGQYSLVIFFKFLLNLSPIWVDKFLVPILASVYIPTVIYCAFKDNFNIKENYLSAIILSLLIFPFTVFISTTPQALASLFFIITIIFTIYYLVYPKTSFWPIFLLSFFVIAVHPLVGLPLFFISILVLVYFKISRKAGLPKLLHRGILWEIFILGAFALPLAFVVNSKTLSQLKVNLNFNALLFKSSNNLFDNWSIFYRPFISIYDFIYTYANNIYLIYIIMFAVGLIYLRKKDLLKNYLIYPICGIMIFINYYLLKTSIDFFSLVSYERQNYPDRVLLMCFFSLIPVIIISAYVFFLKVSKQKMIIKFLVAVFISLSISASFYLSYPRVDTITENHGYSTSQTDFDTVNFIENQQRGQPYIVLASQPVSAAAISQLGYKYYYNNIFFYPVPTGERLYELYEDLVYGKEKTTDIVATVRMLTGVREIYLVINSYWFDSKAKIDQEKEVADKWYAIDAKNYIFKYEN